MRLYLKSSSFKIWRKRVTGRRLKHGFPDHKTRFKSANQKWRLNWEKIAQNALEIFNGERNGPKIGKTSFTAQKDVGEEKIKNKKYKLVIHTKKIIQLYWRYSYNN